ncbi:ABC transporter substrate-binding protein [Stenotrophomonas sp.]|uniref:ABC transporter substrate-binding protein n=1 Tax=Stenotrophomonas sp. TaxID=69392 RepID=UPI0028AB225D|nr:ABC transporter substrate-binding protein [Stenotrophomonas sp.]
MKRFAAGLLSLAIAAAVHAPAYAAGPARALAIDGDVSGEITSSSPVNYSDGTRSQLFSLQMGAGQAVSLKLEGALKGALAVFNRDVLVSRTDGGGEGSTTLSMRADKAGQYLVAVSGADARAFGPFQLSAEPIVAYDGKPLTAGRRVTDWLSNGDKTFVLQVDKPGLYTINLESNEFDARLELSGNGLNLEDDDGGSNLNSRLVAPLQPGRYTLTAGGLGEASGAFYLGVEQSDFPEGLVFNDGTNLPLEGTVSGFIGADDTRSFVLNLPERRRVQLDASGKELDTMLTIQGGDITLSDDDGGGGVNSRISQVLDAGEYNVSVRSVNSRGGVFQLATATAAAPDGPTRPELKLGREVTGQLRAGNRDLYTLEIPRKGKYVISMTAGSSSLDGMITLMRNGEEVAQQDDSDSSLDPNLEIDLEAGRYIVLAHSFDPNATGSYRLLARRK